MSLCQPCGAQEQECEAGSCQAAASQKAAGEFEAQKAAMLAEFEAAMSGSAARPGGERLLDAIMQGNLPEVWNIVENDPGCLSYNSLCGQTPLATAVQWGRGECCAALLDAKCDPNQLDNNGVTAVHHVVGDMAQSGHPLLAGLLCCVDTLVKHKADLSLKDANGSTVLERVLEQECYETAKCLLEAKADPNQPCRSGSLLNAACSGKRTRVAALLLEFRAELTVCSGTTGMGPLHLAARAGATEIVQLLLEAKVHAGAESTQGKTALQLAEVLKGDNTCGRPDLGQHLLPRYPKDLARTYMSYIRTSLG